MKEKEEENCDDTDNNIIDNANFNNDGDNMMIIIAEIRMTMVTITSIM